MRYKGSDDAQAHRLYEVAAAFTPGFRKRLDAIVVFRALTIKDLTQIARLMLGDLADRLQNRGMRLDVTPNATEQFAALSYDGKLGARALRRYLETELEHPLSQLLTN